MSLLKVGGGEGVAGCGGAGEGEAHRRRRGVPTRRARLPTDGASDHVHTGLTGA